MRIIYAQEGYSITNGEETIFLAGPTPRDAETPSWRPRLLDTLEKLGFDGTIFVPEMRNGWTKDFEYSEQIAWEQYALEISSIVLFWVPREMKTMPALTTNFEFGQMISNSPERIIYGRPKHAERMRYLDYMAQSKGIKIFDNIIDTSMGAIRRLTSLERIKDFKLR